MTQFHIQSKGNFQGKPVEVSTEYKALTVLDALKTFIDKVNQANIVINKLTITNGKD